MASSHPTGTPRKKPRGRRGPPTGRARGVARRRTASGGRTWDTAATCCRFRLPDRGSLLAHFAGRAARAMTAPGPPMRSGRRTRAGGRSPLPLPDPGRRCSRGRGRRRRSLARRRPRQPARPPPDACPSCKEYRVYRCSRGPVQRARNGTGRSAVAGPATIHMKGSVLVTTQTSKAMRTTVLTRSVQSGRCRM